MKLYVGLLFSFFVLSSPAFSQVEDKEACISQLTDNYYASSNSFSINTDNYNVRDYGNDHQAYSILMVRLALKEQGCHRDVVNFGQGPRGRSTHKCEVLLPGQDFSQICYIETNLGAFFVTADSQTMAQVIYKRWD